jgi:hypothetical protein
VPPRRSKRRVACRDGERDARHQVAVLLEGGEELPVGLVTE